MNKKKNNYYRIEIGNYDSDDNKIIITSSENNSTSRYPRQLKKCGCLLSNQVFLFKKKS